VLCSNPFFLLSYFWPTFFFFFFFFFVFVRFFRFSASSFFKRVSKTIWDRDQVIFPSSKTNTANHENRIHRAKIRYHKQELGQLKAQENPKRELQITKSRKRKLANAATKAGKRTRLRH
jgi:hypothetical protein